ncbi:MAG: MFS transporter, partial [Anaerolineales bacterium]
MATHEELVDRIKLPRRTQGRHMYPPPPRYNPHLHGQPRPHAPQATHRRLALCDAEPDVGGRDRLGRRNGLTAALLIGIAGAGLAAAATELGVVWAFGLGIIAIGAMRAGTLMARFIAAEVSMPDVRGRAISIVIWAGTIGAVLGPLLVAPSGALATDLGLKELTGPILVAVPLIAIAATVSFVGLRPEPAELSKLVGAESPSPVVEEDKTRPISRLIRVPGVYVAVVTVVLAQAVMVMLMGITALYMRDLGHSLGDISVIFSAYTLGMFAFAPISGRLADR